MGNPAGLQAQVAARLEVDPPQCGVQIGDTFFNDGHLVLYVSQQLGHALIRRLVQIAEESLQLLGKGFFLQYPQAFQVFRNVLDITAGFNQRPGINGERLFHQLGQAEFKTLDLFAQLPNDFVQLLSLVPLQGFQSFVLVRFRGAEVSGCQALLVVCEAIAKPVQQFCAAVRGLVALFFQQGEGGFLVRQLLSAFF